MSNRTYYRAEGKTLERVEEWQAAEQATHEKMIAFAKRFGADRFHTYSDPYQLGGLLFPKEVPEEWRKGANGAYWPRRATKQGKAIYNEMKAIRGKRFEPLLGFNEFMIVGRYRLEASLEQIGDAWFVGVPNRTTGEPFFIPEDAVPLKMSEYWALKEAEPSP